MHADSAHRPVSSRCRPLTLGPGRPPVVPARGELDTRVQSAEGGRPREQFLACQSPPKPTPRGTSKPSCQPRPGSSQRQLVPPASRLRSWAPCFKNVLERPVAF